MGEALGLSLQRDAFLLPILCGRLIDEACEVELNTRST